MNLENIEKIHFEYLGKFRIDWGPKVISVMKCPICKNETTFFRRKGLLKIKCDNCPFETIVSLIEWVGHIVYEEKLNRDIQSFFEFIR